MAQKENEDCQANTQVRPKPWAYTSLYRHCSLALKPKGARAGQSRLVDRVPYHLGYGLTRPIALWRIT